MINDYVLKCDVNQSALFCTVLNFPGNISWVNCPYDDCVFVSCFCIFVSCFVYLSLVFCIFVSCFCIFVSRFVYFSLVLLVLTNLVGLHKFCKSSQLVPASFSLRRIFVLQFYLGCTQRSKPSPDGPCPKYWHCWRVCACVWGGVGVHFFKSLCKSTKQIKAEPISK